MDFSLHNFDSTLDRRSSWSIKWDPDYMIERFGTDNLLPFNHAEMDFICPQPIIDAIQNRAHHGIYGYTLIKDHYYEAVMHWYQRRHGLNLAKNEILYSTGVIYSLRNIIQFFTQKGDEIMLFTPIYQPLSDAITEQNRNRIIIPLKFIENTYYIDYEKIEEILASHTIKMCIICNPHNPVGRVWSESELLKLGELCSQYNVIIVSDEIHCDLTQQDLAYTSILHISEKIGVKSIMLSSMTKTFNTSGLKIANIFIKDPELRKNFFSFYEKKFIYAPNVFGIIGTQAAYNHCEKWVDLVQQYLDQNYKFVLAYIEENDLNLSVSKREGTPLIWIDFSDISVSSSQVFTWLLQSARIIAYDGKDFTANGEGFQRLSIGYPRSILLEGLKRIKHAINTLK